MAQVYLNENSTDRYQLEDGSGVLLLEQEDPTVHRQPLLTTFVKAVTLVAAIISQPVPNLLASTLTAVAPPTAAPFYQLDWPNPSSKAENFDVHGYTNRQPPEETPPPEPPTDATLRSPYFIQELKPLQQIEAILSQPYSNTVIQQAPPLQPDPFRNVDWPNPVERQESEGVDPVPNVTVNLAIPFTSTDWQDPASKYEFVDALAPPNILTTTLAPVVEAAAPFRQTDWPNPSTKAQEIEAHGYNINRVLPDESEELQRSTPYFAGQFKKDRQFEAILAQPVSNLAINLTPAQVAAPFTPVDVPNPLESREFVDSLVAPNLPLTTLTPVVVEAAPFYQTDWPLPSSRVENLEAHGYANRLPPEEGVIVPPTAATQRSAYFVQDLKPSEQLPAILSQPQTNIVIGTSVAPASPFIAFDWQNPALTAPERIEAILSQPVSNIVIRTPSAFSVPFSMVDWPNPVITVPLDISNLGMTGSTHMSFIPPPPEPPEITELRKIITLIEDRIDTILG